IRLPHPAEPEAAFIARAAQPFSQPALAQGPHAPFVLAHGPDLQAPLAQVPASAALAHPAAATAMVHAPPPLDLPLVLLAVWLLGSTVFLVAWTRRWLQLRKVVRSARPIAWSAPMPVLAASSLVQPGLVGFWRPVLLLPQTLPDHLTRSEIDAVLAHEICHLRRRDNLTAAIHMLVEALFWFHPMVWWIGARMIEERERACDEAVLRAGHDRATYARSLVASCRLYLQSPLDCVAGASGSDLKTRVEIIMTAPPASPLSPIKKAMLLAAGACAVATPVTAGLLTTPAAQTVVARAAAAASRAVSLRLAPVDGQAIDIPAGTQAAKPAVLARNEPVLTAGPSVARLDVPAEPLAQDVAAPRVDQVPMPAQAGPGTEDAVRAWILALQTRQPALVKMSPAVEGAAERQWPLTVQMFKAFGALKAVRFVRVTPEGDDAYEADFAHAKIQVMVGPLTADGELSRLAWGPIWDQDLRGDAVRKATPQASGVQPPVYRWGAPAPRAEAAPAHTLRPAEIPQADALVRAQVARWNESRWSLTSADTASPADAKSEVSAFVKSYGGAFWNTDDPICIRVEGLPSDKAASVKARVEADARAAGVSVGRAECGLRYQVEIRFAGDAERAVGEVLNYYHHPVWPFPLERPTGADRPIRAWYGLAYDHAGAPDGHGNLGSDPGARQKFALAIVVADPRRTASMSLDAVSDYVAMLALSQPRALDRCNVLPSVTDLFAGACPGRAAPAGFTAADAAYLKALYTGNSGIRASRFPSELVDRMAQLLGPTRAAAL
ncbi:MAG: M56 family metallopeptidase, partial [Caulobacteraceae bacterium]